MFTTFLKRCYILGLFILVFGIITACSTAEDGEVSQEDKSSESPNEENGEVSGDFEIQYFVGGYGDTWWKEVIADFKETYPNVNVIEHAGPNINDEMKTRWISNDPPDVVYIDGDGASETQMINDGQLMDLSDWLKDAETDDGKALYDIFITPLEEIDGGKVYSLPLAFDTWGVWYDNAWFEQEGFKVPEDFDSWMDSMIEIKEKSGIYPFNTTGNYPQYFQRGVLYPAFAAAGGEELLNDLLNGKVEAWEREETLEVLQKVQKMQEADLVDPAFAARSHTQSQMNFLMHDNAFIPVGFWLPTEMKNDTPEDFEYGFIPTPMNNAGEPMSLVPDLRPVAIAEEAKNPEAAKAFLEFIFTEKYGQKFAESTGAIMDIKDVDLSENENVPTFLKNINDTINNPDKVVVHERKTPEGDDLDISIKISDEVKKQIVPLLLGKIDAEEYIEKIIAVAEKAQK
ncbi:ABC transporter substrate-binding protein [Pseudogracilibacillus auburnensis]|uniref:Carbohydrate ABC transporter substrate-binding protein (CUT1 family) n=1 Tax=Pseudogracilibacillus auburnensis TaxID=1494959 RepID=A0A2V3VV79_9BACI|nr:extracellular solute-binding protein [Pseudogracilibacillus auburnensis]PXW85566.1 carbohydrate ABC transporter substrate-binding protein (CUT1 family) [Pseudogracilibacillus auburnensis]